VGRSGIEKLYECPLRGIYGKKLVEVDSSGKYQKTLSVIPATPGDTVRLTIDWELQKAAARAVAGKKAAVIALNPANGQVLALVSTPSFNLQDFEDNKQDKINEYLKDPAKPLFDRALEGVYPPGSVFKLVVATGALEEKAIDEHTEFEDTGTIQAGAVTFGNWYFLEYGKKEGMVNLVKGLRRSNDIFFYHTGAKLGVDGIRRWGERFGYGRPIDMALHSSEGTIPSPFWKEEVIGDKWYLGDTYNLAIGQGYLEVTPFHVAQSTTPFANGGRLCRPLLDLDANPKCKPLDLQPKTLELVREGMRQACSTGGTGWPLFDFGVAKTEDPELQKKLNEVKSASDEARLIAEHKLQKTKIQVACKTGTAESHGTIHVPHAWITAFAPFDKPEIVVTVMVEEGGQGSDVAGPIARDILKAYFQRTQ
jgi:penicillin-binding protein 2